MYIYIYIHEISCMLNNSNNDNNDDNNNILYLF